MHIWLYIFAMIIFSAGLFIMLTSDHYVRKIIGLGVFQNSILVFYIALGKKANGIVPIDICVNITNCPYVFSSPLPHVLMLTAIVVGFATLSVALALILQIKKAYGTALESEINPSLNQEL